MLGPECPYLLTLGSSISEISIVVVTLRESRLLEAEQEIRKLSNNNEGKVDK